MRCWQALFAAACAIGSSPLLAEDRAAIEDKYKWNLAEIYPSEQAWAQERLAVAADLAKIAPHKGTLGRSADDLYQALALRDAIGQRVARVSVYANMARDIDTRVGRAEQMAQQARQASTDFAAATSWMRPELLALGPEKVHALIAADPRLRPYKIGRASCRERV